MFEVEIENIDIKEEPVSYFLCICINISLIIYV